MKKRFYLKQWLHFKPDNYSSKTDVHYLKIANKIYAKLDSDQNLALLKYINEDDIINLCCFITCYYEDIISQTNIWHAFKKLHAESHKKKLPFYTLDENYIDDEINLEDVTFLMWYYLNTIQDEKFASPYNPLFFNIARQTMQILDEDYEYAPENEVLKNSFKFDLDMVAESDEFYVARSYLQYVFFTSYLFYPDIKRRLAEDVFKIVEERTEEEFDLVDSYVREVTETYTFSKCSALLALTAKDWAKTVLSQSNVNYNAISDISQKITGLFQYKSQSEKDISLEHIASGILFKMTKKSFDPYMDLNEDNIIYIGLVKYKDEWWFSGNFSNQSFDADVILDQKNSAKARSEVSFLEDKKKVASIITQQKLAFLDFNEGSLVAFLTSDDLNPFLNAYFTFFNDSLKLTDQEKGDARERTKADGYFGDMDSLDVFKDPEDIFVVFFNPASGIEFYDDIYNAFPDERNPFFVKESNEDVQHILMSQVYSTEFVNYFIEHYKDKLHCFKTDPYKSYLNDLDFLLKFWKKDNYITKDALVLTG